jgi:hypothetical protein
MDVHPAKAIRERESAERRYKVFFMDSRMIFGKYGLINSNGYFDSTWLYNSGQ